MENLRDINKNVKEKIISCILLGGKSSRMYTNKAFLTINYNNSEYSFLELITNYVMNFSYKIIFNFNNDTFYLYEDKYRLFKDIYKKYFKSGYFMEIFDEKNINYFGPLLGLYSVSKFLYNYFNGCCEYKLLLLAIDQVLINKKIFNYIFYNPDFDYYNFIFFKYLNDIYFLPAFYRLDSFYFIDNFVNVSITKGEKVKISLKNFVNYLINNYVDSIKIIDVERFDKKGLIFFRVNTLKDYEELLNLLKNKKELRVFFNRIYY